MQLSRVFRKEQALVFSVVVVEGGRTVVSGDSFGRVIFWDASTGSQIQSIKLHAADVLILHATGNEVYASGVSLRPVAFPCLFECSIEKSHLRAMKQKPHSVFIQVKRFFLCYISLRDAGKSLSRTKSDARPLNFRWIL